MPVRKNHVSPHTPGTVCRQGRGQGHGNRHAMCTDSHQPPVELGFNLPRHQPYFKHGVKDADECLCHILVIKKASMFCVLFCFHYPTRDPQGVTIYVLFSGM